MFVKKQNADFPQFITSPKANNIITVKWSKTGVFCDIETDFDSEFILLIYHSTCEWVDAIVSLNVNEQSWLKYSSWITAHILIGICLIPDDIWSTWCSNLVGQSAIMMMRHMCLIIFIPGEEHVIRYAALLRWKRLLNELWSKEETMNISHVPIMKVVMEILCGMDVSTDDKEEVQWSDNLLFMLNVLKGIFIDVDNFWVLIARRMELQDCKVIKASSFYTLIEYIYPFFSSYTVLCPGKGQGHQLKTYHTYGSHFPQGIQGLSFTDTQKLLAHIMSVICIEWAHFKCARVTRSHS